MFVLSKAVDSENSPVNLSACNKPPHFWKVLFTFSLCSVLLTSLTQKSFGSPQDHFLVLESSLCTLSSLHIYLSFPHFVRFPVERLCLLGHYWLFPICLSWILPLWPKVPTLLVQFLFSIILGLLPLFVPSHHQTGIKNSSS